MKVSLKIVEGYNKIQQLIIQELQQAIWDTLKKALPSIKSKLKNLVITAIKNSPEYDSLTSFDGKLRLQFGLQDSSTKIEELLELWLNTIEVLIKTGSGLKTSITITAIKSDFTDVLGHPAANQLTAKGEDLPWLEWLCLKGDTQILTEYEVVTNSKTSRSRTHNTLTIKKRGAKWNVPPEFAGFIDNNWITRAIDTVDSEIENIIEKEIVNSWQ